MTFLQKILAHKKEVVKLQKKQIPLEELHAGIEKRPPPHNFREFLLTQPLFHFICEIKKASPSRGVIQPDFDPLRQARFYLKGGASAISILTEDRFFSGDPRHFQTVRKQINLPLLRKDFILDPYQIYETRAMGADIILFISRILSKSQLQEFYAIAQTLQLNVLVEISHPSDLKKIDEFHSKIIGINSRNLETFQVDLNRAFYLRDLIPQTVPTIGESGVQSVEDCLQLAAHGFRGALVGEALMRAKNPQTLLQQWKKRLDDVYTTEDLWHHQS